MTQSISNVGFPPVGNSVSIIVVNYNAGELLESCIRSCLHQAEEVIVVDNGSTDSSVELLEQRFPKEPRLKIFRNFVNLGFAAACNVGASEAQGGFLLFLNPDCVLEPEAVNQMRHAVDGDPSAGMAGGLLLDLDGKEQGGGRRAIPTPWRSFVRVFHLSRFADRWPRLFSGFDLHNQPLPDRPVEVEAISGACTLVKRDAMLDVGSWDDAYFLHCEDLDLCMRYRQKGWNILFVPGARVFHHRGVCGRSRPIFVEWHKHHGMLRFYRKFFRHQYPGALMWLVVIGVWLRFGAICTHTSLQRLRQKFFVGRSE